MPHLELSPFANVTSRPANGKRGRYVAERHEIAERFAEFEIAGPAEIREVDADARYFNPLRREVRSDGDVIGNLGPIRAVARPADRKPQRIAIAGVAT